MKKFKKILSAMLAVTMLATVAICMPVSAADAPTVTATIEGYTGEVGSTFNVVFSYSDVDGLFLDESTWDERAISSLQFELQMAGQGTNITGTGARNAYAISTYGTLAKKPSVAMGQTDNTLRVSVSFDGLAGEYSHDSSNSIVVPVKVLAPYAETQNFTLQNCKIILATYDAAADVSATETLAQTEGALIIDDSAAKIEVGTPEPPQPTVTPAAVEITANTGADSSAALYTFYYATTVTKGDEDITAVDVVVETGAKARKAVLDSSLFALLDGGFTFYVGNTTTEAGATFNATATVVADTTVTDTASYTVQ